MKEDLVIKITHLGSQKLNVLKVIKDNSEMSMTECCDLLKKLPAILKLKLNEPDSVKLSLTLKSFGAKIELVENLNSIHHEETIHHNIIVADERDGFYKAVKIGSQYWMAENLNTNTFQNGDSIPTAHEYEDWLEDCLRIPLQASYNFNRKLASRYGKIYNYKSITDERGLTPKGWRIPSVGDYQKLLEFLGREKYSIDYQLKSTESWVRSKGNNHSGFNAVPSGYFCSIENKFIGEGDSSRWWSSEARKLNDMILPYHFKLFSYKNSKSGFELNNHESNASSGFYVRCVADRLPDNCILL